MDSFNCVKMCPVLNEDCVRNMKPNHVHHPFLPTFESNEGRSCGRKVCSGIGGHEYEYKRNYCLKPKTIIDTNTLGSPIGIVPSSYTMSTADLEISELQPQRFATILKALAKIYLIPEHAWTTECVDEVMQEGQKLYMSSQDDPNESIALSDIYNLYESRIKRNFDYDTIMFEIELNEKFLSQVSAITDIEMEGLLDGEKGNLPIEQLPETLTAFFKKGLNHCLVMLNDWYLLIWYASEVFFILDFYGRSKNDLNTDRTEGVAALICLRKIENVIHLIMNLSDLTINDIFNLREMRVVKVTFPNGKSAIREYKKRSNEYNILSVDYAYLTAFLHLSMNPTDPIRNASAFTTAVAALIASKIDHPTTWTSKQLDKLMCYGVNMCRCCWANCLHQGEPLSVDEFPRIMKLGQFVIQFWLEPQIVTGKWHCIPNYKQSELSTAIQELFEAGHNKLVLQIENQIYALWEKNGFLFLFDPFRHRIQGDFFPENHSEKFASLRMIRSMDLYLNVLNQILGENTRTQCFYLHSLHIRRIELHGVVSHRPFSEHELGEGYDVRSINENICFEEDELRCYIELGDISDYGDDDQDVPPEEPEPKSESEEPEEIEMEEEGEFGEGGEAEVSSGDED